MENIRPVCSLVSLSAKAYLTTVGKNNDPCLQPPDANQVKSLFNRCGNNLFIEILNKLPLELKATLPVIEITSDEEEVNLHYIQLIISGLLEPNFRSVVASLPNSLFDRLFVSLIELAQHPDVKREDKKILIQGLELINSSGLIKARIEADYGHIKALTEKVFPQLIRLRTLIRDAFKGEGEQPCQGLIDTMNRELLFKNLNLSNQDFSGGSLNSLMLDETNFSNCILQDADFTLSQLLNAKFERADLDGTKFVEAQVYGADFNDVNLSDRTIFSPRCYTKHIFSFCKQVPTNWNFLLEAGKAKQNEGDFTSAEIYFKNAFELSNSPEVACALGDLYNIQKKYVLAKDYYQFALDAGYQFQRVRHYLSWMKNLGYI